MYRTAKAQKNGFEAAIIAVRKYLEENTTYPTTDQLIKWCEYQTPKIEGVQHRFATVILPILKYPQYNFTDYSRDHMCQFIYDYISKHSDTIDKNHDVLKIQKCIMDHSIDGKTFIAMDETEWIQKLDIYYISEDVALSYYQIITNHCTKQNEKHGITDVEEEDDTDTLQQNKVNDIKENSITTDQTPIPSTNTESLSNQKHITDVSENTKKHIEEKQNGIVMEITHDISIDDKEMKHNNEMDSEYMDVDLEIESLKRENIELKKKIKKLKKPTHNIHKMSLKALNDLEETLQTELKAIRQVKEKIYQNNIYCILCTKNRKNIVINQCNHFVLCSKCERKLETKKMSNL